MTQAWLNWLGSPLFWFVLAVLLGIVEMVVPTLFFVWFAVAAIAVMVLAFFPLSSGILFAAWAVVSLVLTLFTRRLTRRWSRNSGVDRPLAPVGQRGIVRKEIDPIGIVAIDGVEWSAKSLQGRIAEGMSVEVVQQEGAFLLVRLIPEESL